MQFLVAVNCTSRKTAPPARMLRARSLARGDVQAIADEWRERSGAVHDRIAAGLLYSGRAFSLGLATAKRLETELRVISAGMGLLRCDTAVAPYSLTVASGHPDCVLDRAGRGKRFTGSQWWQALHAGLPAYSPLQQLLQRHNAALLIMSLTGSYLDMVVDELSALDDEDLARLRIVGPRTASRAPDSVRQCVMPYDARLDDPELELKGTAFDFAARALSHFAELVQHDSRISSAAVHARRVRQSLSGRRAPVRAQRNRIDDHTLRRTVRTLRRTGLSRTAAIEHLRQSLGVACQAERFSAMWADEVKNRG